VALSFLYHLVRCVAELLRIHRIDAAAKDAEFLVLRHQLAVLRPDFGGSNMKVLVTKSR